MLALLRGRVSALPSCRRHLVEGHALLVSRHLAGRASGSRPGKDAEPASSNCGGEAPAAGSAASAGSQAASAQAPAKDTARALFALPLYRKPAFPGFYQVVQISEQEVLDFLIALKKSGQGDYLGGFMTKELPSDVAERDLEQQLGISAVAASTSLRRDAGRVASPNELEDVGTVLQVINLTAYPNVKGGQVVVMPQKRIRKTRVVSSPSPSVALAVVSVEHLEEPEVSEGDQEVKDLHEEIVAKTKELLKTSNLYKEQFEQVIRFYDMEHPLKLADLVAGMSLAQRRELQAVLEEDRLIERLRKVCDIVRKDSELVRLQSKVKSQAEGKVTKDQRRLMLMEQMKQITKELGIEKDDKQSLLSQFRDALKDKTVPEEANKTIEAELAKLGTLEPSSSEFNVCRTYLEWLTCLPWGQFTEENRDIQKAEKILEEDHFGLEDVKERILEHIAVSFLKESVQGKIVCLVGPPGVGKTSISKSIARALDRKFFRFSVGGLHDVAELRGHRRTYVGAMPGKLIQCLKITQSSNPVVLIDEVDKLGRDMRGDPSSALLEILDPEQNNSFRDHYLDVPVDLSRVMFLCTANVTDTLPGPLLDRMEIIRIAGYVFEEKLAIANQYLIPQTTDQSGIGKEGLQLKEEALHKLITDYAREAGVRQLNKLIEKICRKVALNMVRKKEEERESHVIGAENLTKFVGQPLHMSDRLFTGGTPAGVVMGLAWTAMGGATLYVEARGRRVGHAQVEIGEQHPGAEGPDTSSKEDISGAVGSFTGSMKVTGQLGSVMSESSAVSLTYARLFVQELDRSNSFLNDAELHLHVPEGATPKDGPSAGVTMATALVSLALNRPVKTDLAMTGELTLTGKVLKVGGIKEKVIAARRERVRTILLPRQNEADFAELKEYLRAGVTAHFVDHYDDVFLRAFAEDQVPALARPSRGRPVATIETPAPVAPAEQEEAVAVGGGVGGGWPPPPADPNESGTPPGLPDVGGGVGEERPRVPAHVLSPSSWSCG